MREIMVRFWLGSVYLATIVGANWAVAEYGVVPVGFGLMAPAAVYVAGLAFTLRDLLQEAAGRAAVIWVIAGGALLSLAVAPPALALASGVAFVVSELADLAVYEPLRRRRWLTAVAASNMVGLIVDSLLFLWLAFGSLAFLSGQIVGKAWMTVAALIVLTIARAIRQRVTA